MTAQETASRIEAERGTWERKPVNGFWVLCRKTLTALSHLPAEARKQSLFKGVFVLVFAGGFVAGLWALFEDGFDFLESLGGIGLVILQRLFAVAFFGLGGLLVLSSLITSYTTFYRSEEMPYLLLQPVPLGHVLLYKFFESVLYASWAFFFIIVPFVGAYAAHEHLSPWFSAWTALFAVPWVLWCCAVGCLAAFTIARWLPRGRWLKLTAVLALGGLSVGVARSFLRELSVDQETTVVLARLIPGLRLASQPLWPSRWVADGILALSRGQWMRGGLLWATVVSNALLALLLVETVGRAWFYEGWQRVEQGGSARRHRGRAFRALDAVARLLPADVRALVAKDVRTFFRDPAQWVQGVFFFGLLGLYFLNLRSLRYHTLPLEWRNVIALLNVFSVAAVLCSFGSRFVYPQLSLEGHSFWILGLAPTSMGRILLAKFGLACVSMVTVSGLLMGVCVRMLDVEPTTRAVSLGLAAAVACAVAGLSTGLGGIFLDLRQRNPSAIVSGFGGTLNLVLSLAFILAVMAPFALLSHGGRLRYLGAWAGRSAWILATAWVVGLTVAAVAIPLIWARRTLAQREY